MRRLGGCRFRVLTEGGYGRRADLVGSDPRIGREALRGVAPGIGLTYIGSIWTARDGAVEITIAMIHVRRRAGVPGSPVSDAPDHERTRALLAKVD